MKISKNVRVIVIAIVGIFSIAAFSSCSKSTEKLLQKTAEEVNKQCPMKIDASTTLDSVGVLSGNTLQYYYTVNFGDQNFSKEHYATLMETLKPGIINQVKANQDPSFGLLKKLKVTFGYIYYDSDGDVIGDLSITPDMYEQ
jgi:hypothetical protein